MIFNTTRESFEAIGSVELNSSLLGQPFTIPEFLSRSGSGNLFTQQFKKTEHKGDITKAMAPYELAFRQRSSENRTMKFMLYGSITLPATPFNIALTVLVISLTSKAGKRHLRSTEGAPSHPRRFFKHGRPAPSPCHAPSRPSDTTGDLSDVDRAVSNQQGAV